jgi:hypothetical protein
MTRDHIPPKGIFPTPRSNDLITVPSCASCNRAACESDELFRVAFNDQRERQLY